MRSGRVEEWVMERGKRGKPGGPTAGRVALRRKGRKGLRWTSEHERGPNTEGEMGDGVSAVITVWTIISIVITVVLLYNVHVVSLMLLSSSTPSTIINTTTVLVSLAGALLQGGCAATGITTCCATAYATVGMYCTVLHSTLQWFISNILYTCSSHPIASSDPRDEMNTQPYLPPSAYPSAPSPPKNEQTKHCKRQYYEEDEKA